MTPLVQQLRDRSDRIVDDELTRLAKRVPELDETSLRTIRTAMDELLERMFLDPVAFHGDRREPQFRRLFALDR